MVSLCREPAGRGVVCAGAPGPAAASARPDAEQEGNRDRRPSHAAPALAPGKVTLSCPSLHPAPLGPRVTDSDAPPPGSPAALTARGRRGASHPALSVYLTVHASVQSLVATRPPGGQADPGSHVGATRWTPLGHWASWCLSFPIREMGILTGPRWQVAVRIEPLARCWVQGCRGRTQDPSWDVRGRGARME